MKILRGKKKTSNAGIFYDMVLNPILPFCSNPGRQFAAGITLEKLSAVTVDDNEEETFVTGGSLDRLQKVITFSYAYF